MKCDNCTGSAAGHKGQFTFTAAIQPSLPIERRRRNDVTKIVWVRGTLWKIPFTDRRTAVSFSDVRKQRVGVPACTHPIIPSHRRKRSNRSLDLPYQTVSSCSKSREAITWRPCRSSSLIIRVESLARESHAPQPASEPSQSPS